MQPEAKTVPRNLGWRKHAAAVLVLLSLFALSLGIRRDALGEGWSLAPYATARKWNNEAAADFLRFALSYRLSSPGPGWAVPSYPADPVETAVGRGLEAERHPETLAPRPGTSVMADGRGHLVYLSFPPGSFLAAHAASVVLGEPLSPGVLQAANLALHLLCALLLYAIAWRAFFRGTDRPRLAAALCTAAASAYLIAPGPLHDHAATFWAHHAFQPVLLLALLGLTLRPTAARAALLGLLAFAGAATEWTGHLLSAGLFAACLLRARAPGTDRRAELLAAGAVVLGEVAADLWLAALYASSVGLGNYLSVLAGRAAGRAAGAEAIGFGGYARSLLFYCGPHLLLAAACAVPALLRGGRNSGRSGAAVLAVLAFACAENPLLASHAATYSFDQLKVVALVVLLLAWAGSRLGRPGAFAALAGSGAVALLSVGLYLPLYGDRLDQATYRMSSASACMRAGRDAASDVLDALMPGELPISTPAQVAEPFLGRTLAVADTTGEAVALMRRAGAAAARYMVFGGSGFGGDARHLAVGRMSAEIALSRGAAEASFSLHPLQAVTTGGGAEILLANARTAALARPGRSLRDAVGQDFLVTAADPAAGRVALSGDGQPRGELTGTVPLDAEALALPLAPGGEPDDLFGCNRGERPDVGSAFRRALP